MLEKYIYIWLLLVFLFCHYIDFFCLYNLKFLGYAIFKNTWDFAFFGLQKVHNFCVLILMFHKTPVNVLNPFLRANLSIIQTFKPLILNIVNLISSRLNRPYSISIYCLLFKCKIWNMALHNRFTYHWSITTLLWF